MGLLQVAQQMEEEVEHAQGQDPRPRFTDSIRNEREGLASIMSQLAKLHLKVCPHLGGKAKSGKCGGCLQERGRGPIGKTARPDHQIFAERGAEKRTISRGRLD